MKYLFSLGLLFIVCNLSAQDTYLFQPEHKENSIYKTQMRMETKVEELEGPEAMKAAMGAAMGNVMSMEMSMTTQAKSADGAIPFVISYDNMSITSAMLPDGIPGMSDALKDIKIMGYISDGIALKVDSISGGDGDPMIKQTMEQMLEQVTQSIQFPEKPMAIGDSFEQDFSEASPLKAQMPNSTMLMKYTLVKVEGNIAFIDFEVNMEGEMSGMMTMTGIGVGTSTFDLDDLYVTSSTSDINMTMDMKMGEETMKIVTKMAQNMTITLVK